MSLRDAVARFRAAPVSVGVVDIPRVRGSESTAVRGPDGKWTVRDVPLFADTERQFVINGKPVPYVAKGREWHEAAIRRANERHAETGYMPRLIVRHTEKGKEREGVGFVMPRRVATMRVDGAEKFVTFGDYVGLDDSAYQRLKRGEFPYRSAETPIDGRPEFKKVALLPDDEPFHHFGPTTIGREIRSDLNVASGVASFRSTAKTARLLLRIHDMPDADPAKQTNDEPAAKSAATLDTIAQGIADLAAMFKDFLSGASERDAGADEPKDDETGPAKMGDAELVAKFKASEDRANALQARVDTMEAEAKVEAAVKANVAKMKGKRIGGSTDHEKIARDAVATFGVEKAAAHIDAIVKMAADSEPGDEPIDGLERTEAAMSDDDATAQFSAEYDRVKAAAPHALGALTREKFIEARKVRNGIAVASK